MRWISVLVMILTVGLLSGCAASSPSEPARLVPQYGIEGVRAAHPPGTRLEYAVESAGTKSVFVRVVERVDERVCTFRQTTRAEGDDKTERWHREPIAWGYLEWPRQVDHALASVSVEVIRTRLGPLTCRRYVARSGGTDDAPTTETTTWFSVDWPGVMVRMEGHENGELTETYDLTSRTLPPSPVPLAAPPTAEWRVTYSSHQPGTGRHTFTFETSTDTPETPLPTVAFALGEDAPLSDQRLEPRGPGLSLTLDISAKAFEVLSRGEVEFVVRLVLPGGEPEQRHFIAYEPLVHSADAHIRSHPWLRERRAEVWGEILSRLPADDTRMRKQIRRVREQFK